MTDERPKSSEEMLREANSRLRGPQPDPLPQPPRSVQPPPPPVEVSRKAEEAVDYELEELEKLEREAELGYQSPDPGTISETYGPLPSSQPVRGSRFARLALRFGLGVVVFAGIGFFSSLNDADRDDTGELVSAGDLDVMTLQIGDCFDDAAEFEEVVFTVAAIPCSEAHDNEVYSIIPVTVPGPAFPGVTELQDFAYEACVGAPFSDYVGIDYLDSALEVFSFTPTEESWDGGDRSVTCVLYKLDLTKLVGTARGSGL
jgi:hypothetical protein